MKIATRARLATILFATFLFAATVVAQPTDNMIGTWECRQPGVQYGNKPPILYVEGSITKDSSRATFALEIDGFVREVYGFSEVTADVDGWWRITPKQGEAFTIRPEGVTKSRTASMALRRAGATYRCLRLPLVVQPSAPTSPQPPGTLNIPESGDQNAPATGERSEEPEKKE
jgi:hypothetical protein